MKVCKFLFLVIFPVIFSVSPICLSRSTISDESPLPAWETSKELALRQKFGWPDLENIDTPPTGEVQSHPEWAPAAGVMISWISFESFLTDMTREFVQVGKCYIVVESSSQQTNVTNHLISQGIPTDNVEFLIYNMDSVWMIDYGPFFVTVDDNREIIDHIYDRYGRWNDDALPSNLGASWSIPVYESDLRIEGGNFIADGLGTGFITERVIEQNASYLTEQEVYDRLDSYCGIETTHVLNKINDGTGHIDMFAKLLDADTMMIAQYDPGDPEYGILEANAATVASLIAPTGNPYEVIRIPMPGNPNAYWTYTNSIIVNDHVFVPVYNDPLDTQALAIYEAAMPGYTIVGIDSSSVIGSGGAVHCTTKVIPTAAQFQAGINWVSIDDSNGDNDNRLDPGESIALEVALTNQGIQDLMNVTGILSCNEPDYVSFTVDNCSWPDIPSSQNAACLFPFFALDIAAETPEGTELHFNLAISADGYSDSISFSLPVTSIARAYYWSMDTDPNWSVEGLWAWGTPQGNDDDPLSGHTGSYVYGYNLAGAYENNLSETCLTTSPFDCSNLQNVSINFMRWLGVESSQYDHASCAVSTNGSTWTTIWEHSGGSLNDSAWIQSTYDISQVADGNSTVYFRWIMGSTDSSVTYCGWNIDDVEIWGVSTNPHPTATPTLCIHSGDTNLDGSVTAGDAQMAFQITLGMVSPTTEEECAADCNGDSDVTAGDAQGIFQTALGTGECADSVTGQNLS